jgi:hypothetical protein
VPLILVLFLAGGLIEGGAIPLGPTPVPVMRAALRGVWTVPGVTPLAPLIIPVIAAFFVTPALTPRPTCVAPLALVILAAMALRPVSPRALAPCDGRGAPRLGALNAPPMVVILAAMAFRPCGGCGALTAFAWELSTFFVTA